MAASRDGIAPHMHFMIRPSGRGAPAIDLKPILDGWKLLEATAIYRAAGKNPFENAVGIGAILLMSKEQLIQRVLSDPRLEIYSVRPHRHPKRPDQPPHPGAARVPRGELPPRGHLAQVRPLVPHRLRQRLQPLVRQRGRHPDDQRHPRARQPGSRDADGGAGQDRDGPPGDDGSRRADLADGLRRPQLRPLRPRRPRHVGYSPGYGDQIDQQFVQLLAGPVGAPDRPPRRDRQPGRPVSASKFSLPAKKAEQGDKGKDTEGGASAPRRPHRRVAPPSHPGR